MELTHTVGANCHARRHREPNKSPVSGQVWIQPLSSVAYQGGPETSKPVEALAVALGCPPELESKVLRMETP